MLHKGKIDGWLLMRGLLLVMLLFVSFPTVFSQIRTEPKPPKKTSIEEEKARVQTRWMYKNLTLGPDQYEKINEINLTYAYQSDSIDSIKNKAKRTDSKEKIKLVKDTKIKEVLTPEQYKQYVAHKEKQTSQKKSPFSGTYFGK
jgi:hypothetical protein